MHFMARTSIGSFQITHTSAPAKYGTRLSHREQFGVKTVTQLQESTSSQLIDNK